MQETSQSERSKSKVGSSINSSRVTSTSSFDDEQIAFQRRENLFYPLFSEISQIVKIPSFIYFISQLISLFQFLVSGLWSNSLHFWKDDVNGNAAIRIYQSFIDCGLHKWDSSNSLISYIILIVIFVIILGWHIFVIVYYYYYRQFPKSLLYVTQILQMVILPPIIPFFASHAGMAFSRMATESMTPGGTGVTYPALFIVFVIALIVLFALFYVCFSFTCLSPILSPIIDASWDPKPIIFMLFLICYSSFFGPVLNHFAAWATMIFILASIAITIYTIIQLKDFPFHRFWINPVFAGISVGHIFFEVLLIPSCFSAPIPSAIYVIVSIVLIVVSVAVAYVILNIKRKKIVSQLSYSSIKEENITDPDKKAHFETLDLKTASDIHSFLRIGLAYNCDLFLDFSFPHYIVENYATQELVLAVSQMISFFPKELQYLAYCLGMISKLGELSFQNHYLFFQMKKVHLMRQSSLSKEASSTVKKIHKQSMDAISAIRGFWREVESGHANLDFNSLIAVQKTTNKLKGTFQDLTERFSNNQEMCNEYATFLVEGAGDFNEALKWKGKAHLLELGKRLDNDFALRSLVNTYPQYLLDQIIDIHGNFIKSKTQSSASASASVSVSTSGISSESSNNTEAHFQKMDDLSQNWITESKLRLSVQKSLQHTSFPGLPASKYVFILQFIVAVIIFIVLAAWTPSLNSEISAIVDEVQNMAYVCLHMGYTTFTAAHTLTMHPLFDTFGGYPVIQNLSGFPQSMVDIKEHSVIKNNFEHLGFYVNLGHESLDKLLQGLMTHPDSRMEALGTLLYSNYTIINSFNGTVHPDSNMTVSVRSAILHCFLFYLEAVRQKGSNLENENITADMLVDGVYNMIKLTPYVEGVMKNLTDIGDKMVESKKKTLMILEIVLPLLFGVVFLIIQARTMYLLYKKTNKTLNVLRKVKPETIEESLEPIMINTKEKKINIGSSQLRTSTSLSYAILPTFSIVGIIINAMIIFLIFFMGIHEIGDVSSLFTWYYLTSSRLDAIFYSISSIAFYSYSKETRDEFLNIINLAYQKIEKMHSALLGGDKSITRLVGFDEAIDHAHFIDPCDNVPTTYYGFYLCLSIDRGINEMQILLKRIIRSINISGDSFVLNMSEYTDALILLDYKLAQQMFNFQNAMVDYMYNEFFDVKDVMTILCIVGIIVSALILALSFIFIHSFDVALKGICQLIRLLPPSSMAKNKSLLEFVVGTNRNENESVLTPAQSIVLASTNASISVSLDYTINSVNPSFKTITGLTPDEVLGQPLVILFPFPTGGSSSSSSSVENSSLQVLYDKLSMMKNNETDKVSEKLIMKCTNDIGKPLHVEVTLIAIKNANNETQSFVLFLKDMAAEKQQEMSARNAKRRSEKILQHLLPPLVYESVMKGDKDTNTLFVSNAATVISIQIVGLLDCVNTLSPSQLINVLLKINEAFDETASKYPVVHPIGTQDENLLACCGIFDYMDQPKEQVQQAVVFALELNSLIDDLNEQLVVDLQFRIGINHGGPLAGSVLDLKTPTFDLVGNAVTLPAYQLSGEGEPGKVQITESVYALLEQNEYVFEKGKAINVNGASQPVQIYYVKDVVE